MVERRRSGWTLCGLGLALVAAPLIMSATYVTLEVSWPRSTEPDLTRYVIHWGTQSGDYSLPPAAVMVKTDCSPTTCSRSFFGLDPTQTYFFVLTAIDEAGNESAPSPEASGQPRVAECVPPVVTGAEDALTATPYLIQCAQRSVSVTGSGFLSQVSVDFIDSSISVAAVSSGSSGGATELLVDATAAAITGLGAKDLRVTNAGTCSATLSEHDPSLKSSVEVVKSPDFNKNGRVGAEDFNDLAIAFGSEIGGAKYNPAADMNGDGIINGDDLNRFAPFLGLLVTPCP